MTRLSAPSVFLSAGVVTVSWYPPGASDDEGQPPDRLIPLLLDTAAKYDVKVRDTE